MMVKQIPTDNPDLLESLMCHESKETKPTILARISTHCRSKQGNMASKYTKEQYTGHGDGELAMSNREGGACPWDVSPVDYSYGFVDCGGGLDYRNYVVSTVVIIMRLRVGS